MIRYKCRKCKNTLESAENMAGQFDLCPICKTKFIVPTPHKRINTNLTKIKKDESNQTPKWDQEACLGCFGIISILTLCILSLCSVDLSCSSNSTPKSQPIVSDEQKELDKVLHDLKVEWKKQEKEHKLDRRIERQYGRSMADSWDEP